MHGNAAVNKVQYKQSHKTYVPVTIHSDKTLVLQVWSNFKRNIGIFKRDFTKAIMFIDNFIVRVIIALL